MAGAAILPLLFKVGAGWVSAHVRNLRGGRAEMPGPTATPVLLPAFTPKHNTRRYPGNEGVAEWRDSGGSGKSAPSGTHFGHKQHPSQLWEIQAESFSDAKTCCPAPSGRREPLLLVTGVPDWCGRISTAWKADQAIIRHRRIMPVTRSGRTRAGPQIHRGPSGVFAPQRVLVLAAYAEPALDIRSHADSPGSSGGGSFADGHLSIRPFGEFPVDQQSKAFIEAEFLTAGDFIWSVNAASMPVSVSC